MSGTWRRRVAVAGAIAARGDYAYVGVGPRVVVLDVANPAQPREIGRTPPLTGLVRSLAVDGGLVSAATVGGGLWVVDVDDPERPRPVGHSPPRSHSLDVAVANGFAYIADAEAGLRIVDSCPCPSGSRRAALSGARPTRTCFRAYWGAVVRS